MSGAPLHYVVVEGPIGVGKTTLAQRLARSLGGQALLEGADENPFLARFYENPRAYALGTQLFFLLQRARQMQVLRQADLFTPVQVADFMIEKDRLFAQITLDGDEMRLYEQIYAHLSMDSPTPNLIIYLQAPLEVLLERIARRGLAHEQRMDEAYLRRLSDAYLRFFYNYAAAPLLIVNAAELDFTAGHRDYELLLSEMRRIRTGRHYFNPAPG